MELPKLFELAKNFLHFPISTAAVERSFSKYNQLLTCDRQSLKESSIKALIFLYYNKNNNQDIENFLASEDDDDDIIRLSLALKDSEDDDDDIVGLSLALNNDDDTMSGIEELNDQTSD